MNKLESTLLLNNHFELEIQQSYHTMPLVLALNRKVSFSACIYTPDEFYSQILSVDSCRSLDLILCARMYFLHLSAIIFILYYLQVQVEL